MVEEKGKYSYLADEVFQLLLTSAVEWGHNNARIALCQTLHFYSP